MHKCVQNRVERLIAKETDIDVHQPREMRFDGIEEGD